MNLEKAQKDRQLEKEFLTYYVNSFIYFYTRRHSGHS